MEIFGGFLHTFARFDQRGEVQRSLKMTFFEQIIQRDLISNAALYESSPIWHSGTMPTKQIVVNGDLMPRFEQIGGSRRADIACPTCNENSHYYFSSM